MKVGPLEKRLVLEKMRKSCGEDGLTHEEEIHKKKKKKTKREEKVRSAQPEKKVLRGPLGSRGELARSGRALRRKKMKAPGSYEVGVKKNITYQ